MTRTLKENREKADSSKWRFWNLYEIPCGRIKKNWEEQSRVKTQRQILPIVAISSAQHSATSARMAAFLVSFEGFFHGAKFYVGRRELCAALYSHTFVLLAIFVIDSIIFTRVMNTLAHKI